MNPQALAAFSGVLLILYGSVVERVHAAESKPPPSTESPASVVVTAEEPRGVLSLRDVLSLTLLRNPALSAFTYELRVAEARTIQASVLPNPAFTAELENIGGTGSVTKGGRARQRFN